MEVEPMGGAAGELAEDKAAAADPWTSEINTDDLRLTGGSGEAPAVADIPTPADIPGEPIAVEEWSKITITTPQGRVEVSDHSIELFEGRSTDGEVVESAMGGIAAMVGPAGPDYIPPPAYTSPAERGIPGAAPPVVRGPAVAATTYLRLDFKDVPSDGVNDAERVLRLIKAKGPIKRSGIATELGLTPAEVDQACTTLLRDRPPQIVITEDELPPLSGGSDGPRNRPPEIKITAGAPEPTYESVVKVYPFLSKTVPTHVKDIAKAAGLSEPETLQELSLLMGLGLATAVAFNAMAGSPAGPDYVPPPAHVAPANPGKAGAAVDVAVGNRIRVLRLVEARGPIAESAIAGELLISREEVFQLCTDLFTGGSIRYAPGTQSSPDPSYVRS